MEVGKVLTRRDVLRTAVLAGAAIALDPLTAAATVIKVRPRIDTWRDWNSVTIEAPTDGTDATATILDQVMAAAPRTVIRFPRGEYRVEGSLVISDKRQLALRGPATFYATAPGPLDPRGMSQRRHWLFDRCSDIRLEDLHVRSTNLEPDQREGFGAYLAQYEFEHGFAVHGSSNITIRNCSTKGTWGDGFYVGNSTPSRNVVLEDVQVEFNGRQGIAVSNADDVVISRARILNTRRAGIDLEPSASSWAVRGVRITDSFVNGYHVAFAAGGNGDVSDVEIRRNRIRGPGVPWVYVVASDGTRRRNWVIRDNLVGNQLGSPVAALRFARVDDIVIDNNVSPIVSTQSRLAVELNETGNVTISRNDFREATTLYRTIGTVGPIEAYGNLVD